MQRHRCALILLGGWLLMQPPLIEDKHAPAGFTVQLQTPVQEWDQASAHDSAAECERVRTNTANGIGVEFQRSPPESKGRKIYKELVRRVNEARCVPADHIYSPTTPIK